MGRSCGGGRTGGAGSELQRPLSLLPGRRRGGLLIFTRAARRTVATRTAIVAVAATEAAAVLTVAAEATILARTAIAEAAVATIVAIAIGLAHHRRGAFLEFVDAHGEIAQHVLVDALLAFDLGNNGRGAIDVEHHEMRLAVLVDAVGQRAQAPLLGLGDLAAKRGDDAGDLVGDVFDLLRARVLTREKHMLIERHGRPFSC